MKKDEKKKQKIKWTFSNFSNTTFDQYKRYVSGLVEPTPSDFGMCLFSILQSYNTKAKEWERKKKNKWIRREGLTLIDWK